MTVCYHTESPETNFKGIRQNFLLLYAGAQLEAYFFFFFLYFIAQFCNTDLPLSQKESYSIEHNSTLRQQY